MVSISSSKQMSHCVPPFAVGNATIPISSRVNQSSSDRLLRVSSLPLRERIRLQHRTKRQPETEMQEIQVQLLALPELYRDVGIIT